MAREYGWALGGIAGLVLLAVASIKGKAQTPVYPAPQPSKPPLDAYAEREPQTQCIMIEQPGVLEFRSWVLSQFGEADGAIKNILRACDVGGMSEHKEGRAWDWFPRTPADGNELVAMLTAPDAYGRPDALARRAGIMYMVWNRKIWRAYPWAGAPRATWQPYTGTNPHTDHVHFSFSWAGAKALTSLYNGVA